VQWDVLAEDASSDLAEAVWHQKEARIGINDPIASCLREGLDVAECWKEAQRASLSRYWSVKRQGREKGWLH
jgi:hypothetical protein